MIEELKPCPFCGGKVEFDTYDMPYERDIPDVFPCIKCDKCSISTNHFDIENAENFIALWNKRHESEKYEELLNFVQGIEIFRLAYIEKITDAQCDNDLIDVFKSFSFDARKILFEIGEHSYCINKVEEFKKIHQKITKKGMAQ